MGTASKVKGAFRPELWAWLGKQRNRSRRMVQVGVANETTTMKLSAC